MAAGATGGTGGGADLWVLVKSHLWLLVMQGALDVAVCCLFWWWNRRPGFFSSLMWSCNPECCEQLVFLCKREVESVVASGHRWPVTLVPTKEGGIWAKWVLLGHILVSEELLVFSLPAHLPYPIFLLSLSPSVTCTLTLSPSAFPQFIIISLCALPSHQSP